MQKYKDLQESLLTVQLRFALGLKSAPYIAVREVVVNLEKLRSVCVLFDEPCHAFFLLSENCLFSAVCLYSVVCLTHRSVTLH